MGEGTGLYVGPDGGEDLYELVLILGGGQGQVWKAQMRPDRDGSAVVHCAIKVIEAEEDDEARGGLDPTGTADEWPSTSCAVTCGRFTRPRGVWVPRPKTTWKNARAKLSYYIVPGLVRTVAFSTSPVTP